ncbi:hypothetical protein ACWT_6846 [Actinoplanes sp. SE50]|uniref:DUF397 domain-containing protein n=1 Tax=unclassified Actinoplanes TaxID=2626549 RepID=UPI00023ED331|nr:MULTISPECIES: DUF397 domain-containing protein [unclassified Actinoplanes]AEV87859.1 hypothetical protein ACPL_6977 [Actinoplanes sp. SE50/110]ATO86261.1 hypothetical protein ACWT_6846 [Actinoplanes sp. SE50]SLM03676.1 hypothetical protein ACSP50_6972 [Actinoplanes sp. SE50/110]
MNVGKNVTWFTSSRSGAAGHCVETAFLENNQVAVRDSKNRAGPTLIFTGPEWEAFVAGAKAGEFDLP